MTAKDNTRATRGRGVHAPAAKAVRPRKITKGKPISYKENIFSEDFHRRNYNDVFVSPREKPVKFTDVERKEFVQRWIKIALNKRLLNKGYVLPHQKRKLQRLSHNRAKRNNYYNTVENVAQKDSTRKNPEYFDNILQRLNALPSGFTDDLIKGEPWPKGIQELLGPIEE